MDIEKFVSSLEVLETSVTAQTKVTRDASERLSNAQHAVHSANKAISDIEEQLVINNNSREACIHRGDKIPEKHKVERRRLLVERDEAKDDLRAATNLVERCKPELELEQSKLRDLERRHDDELQHLFEFQKILPLALSLHEAILAMPDSRIHGTIKQGKQVLHGMVPLLSMHEHKFSDDRAPRHVFAPNPFELQPFAGGLDLKFEQPHEVISDAPDLAASDGAILGWHRVSKKFAVGDVFTFEPRVAALILKKSQRPYDAPVLPSSEQPNPLENVPVARLVNPKDSKRLPGESLADKVKEKLGDAVSAVAELITGPEPTPTKLALANADDDLMPGPSDDPRQSRAITPDEEQRGFFLSSLDTNEADGLKR